MYAIIIIYIPILKWVESPLKDFTIFYAFLCRERILGGSMLNFQI